MDAGEQPDAGSRKLAIDEDVLEAHRIVARRPADRDADIFRILRTKLQQTIAGGNLRSIGITSPNYGDGKTTIAANLALSLALDVRQSVCLVDLDLRHPGLNKVLDLGAENGLSDYLLADSPLAQCLVRPPYDRLVVLANNTRLQNSSEALGAPKMAALARELKARYRDRIVIYDLPPVLPTDDTIGFLPNLDAAVLVVREGVTQVEDVRRALHALGDTVLLGTVLNRSSWRDRSMLSVRGQKPRRLPRRFGRRAAALAE